MMTNANLHARPALDQPSWSNRVLLLSLAGIFFLTLYPFQFAPLRSASFLASFALHSWGKGLDDPVDVTLNILLFVPLGFGLAEKFRERGKSKTATLATVYLAGALLSYFVEFLQFHIPHRDSGWGDVITNSFGAFSGAWIFEVAGVRITSWFSARERELDSWIILPRIGVILAMYAGFWCLFVAPLQKQAKITNWSRDSFLAVGDHASLYPAPPWQGRILEMDIWSHDVSPTLARRLTSEQSIKGGSSGALVSYIFSGRAPFHDVQRFLPDLDWASKAPLTDSGDGAVFDGRSWLISTGGVPMLVNSVEDSGQFAIRLICQPAKTSGPDGTMVSVSSPSGSINLELEQSGSSLGFWFRNRLSIRRSRMAWEIPQVFATHHMRNVLISFNGSALSLYLDGKEYGNHYNLGPGAALAHYVRRLKTGELEGYALILYAMIFVPMGCILGFAWRRSHMRSIGRLSFLLAGYLLPAVAVEWTLASVAGRSISPGQTCFSVLLALAGSIWMNADRSFTAVLRSEQELVSAR